MCHRGHQRSTDSGFQSIRTPWSTTTLDQHIVLSKTSHKIIHKPHNHASDRKAEGNIGLNLPVLTVSVPQYPHLAMQATPAASGSMQRSRGLHAVSPRHRPVRPPRFVRPIHECNSVLMYFYNLVTSIEGLHSLCSCCIAWHEQIRVKCGIESTSSGKQRVGLALSPSCGEQACCQC